MRKRRLVLGLVVVLAAAGVAITVRYPDIARASWARVTQIWSGGANAQAPRQAAPRAVPVEAAIAQKKTVPVQVEALGNVTPIQSVAIKPRIDSEIVGVHFRDGAMVKHG